MLKYLPIFVSLLLGIMSLPLGCSATSRNERSPNTLKSTILPASNPPKLTASKQQSKSTWQQVLDAAKIGTINLGGEYPPKPWLLVNMSDANGNSSYDLIDQNNQAIAIDYLMSDLTEATVISDSILYLFYDRERNLGIWDTQSKTFKLENIPFKFTEFIVGQGKFYIETKPNSNDECQVYELDAQTLAQRLVINSKTNPDYNCDPKDHIRYVDHNYLWSVWGHGSSGGLDVYYNQYDLKTGKLAQNLTLSEGFKYVNNASHLISVTVELAEKIPNRPNKQLFVYECKSNLNDCPDRESEAGINLHQQAMKILEDKVPFLTAQKNFRGEEDQIKCGKFDYRRSYSTDETKDRITFNNQEIEKYQKVSISSVGCVK